MNILLISEDSLFAKGLSEKLIFLRSDDKVILSSYSSAQANLIFADVILVHENENFHKSINLIKELRKNTNSEILFLANSKDPELILKAVDSGANDFILSEAEDYEFVIRIVNSIKYCSQNNLMRQYKKLFEQIKVKDELTGLWNYSYSKQIIENVIDCGVLKTGTFMVISPSKSDKIRFSAEKFANILKKSIRMLDIITLGKGLNFYIFMPDTDFNGAVSVLNKIKDSCRFSICAGISSISNKQFEDIENGALKALSEAMATDTDFVYADEEKEETLENWLEDSDKKGYKIFRQMFNKKLEKVITPVFYRLQKTYEAKLFATEIEQSVSDEKCVFSLKNKRGVSSLSIVYPGFSKIIITIRHEGLDSPENKELQLQLSKITQRELIEIVEDFIKEFKSRD